MTSTITKVHNGFVAAFDEVVRRANDEPAWLRDFRIASFERFRQRGFPSVTEEEWKYTNIAPIAKADFAPVIHLNGAAPTEMTMRELAYQEARVRFVFINGIFRRELSLMDEAPPGLTAIDLKEAANDARFAGVIRESLDQHGDAPNGFVALNNALFSGGLLLKLEPEVAVSGAIHLAFLATSVNGDRPAVSPRVLVHAGKNCAATIIESYTSAGGSAYLTNAVVDFQIDDSAQIQHYKVQRESAAGFHIAATNAVLGRAAKYKTTSINLGGAISRHNIEVLMDHEGAECAVDGLYMVEGSQHTDTHSVIDHASPHCTSRQIYKGILDGKSRAVFNGKVFVRHGAQQTDAQQTNKNLLLSKEAQVDTKPQLEIYADDVKCTHGAAVGQLDEDELFYLESRGINPSLARNMLTYGFAEEVIEKITIESIKRELDSIVLNRLNQGSGAHGLEDLT
ncbi:MAG TPA: Fe-S cluster assembly protein SufD [Pyrinomonadaceae bacterium]|jgi:Fe-S cluster assembly protein SufD|nr:Fe-S cluster assembly protein SufD [Pyrinomonadaceae bacterium]